MNFKNYVWSFLALQQPYIQPINLIPNPNHPFYLHPIPSALDPTQPRILSPSIRKRWVEDTRASQINFNGARNVNYTRGAWRAPTFPMRRPVYERRDCGVNFHGKHPQRLPP